MTNNKTIYITIGIIILAGLLGLTFLEVDSEPTPTADIDTSDWQTYENEEYGFSLQYPDGWEVAEETDHPVNLMFSVYQPDTIEGEPPFIHHSAETHTSVYPQGIPTEGFSGETITSTIDFNVPINRADDYVLSDGTDFATYANVEALADGWNESGFLFSHTAIDNLETECRRDGEVIPDQQCDVLTGDTLVRFGDIDEETRAIQKAILESFQLTE